MYQWSHCCAVTIAKGSECVYTHTYSMYMTQGGRTEELVVRAAGIDGLRLAVVHCLCHSSPITSQMSGILSLQLQVFGIDSHPKTRDTRKPIINSWFQHIIIMRYMRVVYFYYLCATDSLATYGTIWFGSAIPKGRQSSPNPNPNPSMRVLVEFMGRQPLGMAGRHVMDT